LVLRLVIAEFIRCAIKENPMNALLEKSALTAARITSTAAAKRKKRAERKYRRAAASESSNYWKKLMAAQKIHQLSV